MIVQTDDLGRIALIYIAQLILSIIFLFITFKMLKRNRNRLTYVLSGFYISVAAGFIINAIYIPLEVNPLVFILYFMIIFLVLFGQIFLLMFILLLYRTDSNIQTKNLVAYIAVYAILIFSILYFPNGITINEQTDWRPIWSWSFFMIVTVFCLCFIVSPFTYIFIKLYMHFEDRDLKKKLLYFFSGFCGIVISFIGGMIYVTLYNPIFNAVWNVILFFIIISSCLLIYYGIASEL